MKKTNFTPFILYFFLLVSVALVFYYRYYPRLINQANSGQRLISNNSNQTVFFVADKSLYKIFASNSLDRLGAPRMELLSKNSTFNSLVNTEKNTLFIDDQTTRSSIIELDLSTNNKTVIASSAIAGLNNFNTFSKPVISPNKKLLIFKAQENNQDSLLLYDLKNSKITNLTSKLNLNQIFDYVWQDDKTIIIAGGATAKYAIIRYNLQSLKAEILKQSSDQMDSLHFAKNVIFYLKKELINNKNTTNLASLNLKNQKQQSISSVSEKYLVTNYDISDDAEFAVLEIRNIDDNSSNLSLSKIDRADLLQITTDNKSSLPVFLANSNEFVFWIKGDGLYKTTATKIKPLKLINLLTNVEQIFVWR